MPHESTIHVRFYELDPYNHLNHAVYVQYFEVARINLLEAVGFGLTALETMGYQLVVTDLSINYRKSAGPHDALRIETEVAEIRRVSSRWRQRMFRNGDLLASQTVSAATINPSGKVVRFPAELVAALEPFMADPSLD